MFRELVGGAGCVGGQEKEWMGVCLLDDLRADGINADQCFMAKWIAAKKARAGLRLEREWKDQGENSPKQACSCCFPSHY